MVKTTPTRGSGASPRWGPPHHPGRTGIGPPQRAQQHPSVTRDHHCGCSSLRRFITKRSRFALSILPQLYYETFKTTFETLMDRESEMDVIWQVRCGMPLG